MESCKIYLGMFSETELFSIRPHCDCVCDFRSGSMAEKKSSSGEFLDLFVSIYADEISLSNPLGGARHSNRLWKIYGQVLNMPKELRSKLDSIFMIASIDTNHIPKYTLNKCIKPVIASLKRAQIPFEMDGFSKKIRIRFLNFIGDSPASNFFAGIFE